MALHITKKNSKKSESIKGFKMKKKFQKRLATAKASYMRPDDFFINEMELMWEEIEKIKRRKHDKQSFCGRFVANLMSFAQSSAAKWRSKVRCKKA